VYLTDAAMSERCSQREPHAESADHHPTGRRHTVGCRGHLQSFRPAVPSVHQEDTVRHDFVMPFALLQNQLTTAAGDPLDDARVLRHCSRLQALVGT
jgi:hypothetical protein